MPKSAAKRKRTRCFREMRRRPNGAAIIKERALTRAADNETRHQRALRPIPSRDRENGGDPAAHSRVGTSPGADPVGEPACRCGEGTAEEEIEGIDPEDMRCAPAGFGEQRLEKATEGIERPAHDEHDNMAGNDQDIPVEEVTPTGRPHRRALPGLARTTDVAT